MLKKKAKEVSTQIAEDTETLVSCEKEIFELAQDIKIKRISLEEDTHEHEDLDYVYDDDEDLQQRVIITKQQSESNMPSRKAKSEVRFDLGEHNSNHMGLMFS